MKSETNKSFKLTAILLALALLFPFTSEALHHFSHQDHEHCTDNTTTHFHKHDFECEIFDFHLTPISEVSIDLSESPKNANYKTIFPPVEEFYLEKISFQIKLRGPPACA